MPKAASNNGDQVLVCSNGWEVIYRPEHTTEQAMELVGWRVAKKDDKHAFSIPGKKGKFRFGVKFCMDKNQDNRKFQPGLALQYAEQMLRGEWAGDDRDNAKTGTGESMTSDEQGNVVSCAHRNAALIIAEMERKRLIDMGDTHALESLYGIDDPEKPIVIKDTLLVRNIDSEAADDTDKGKSRDLKDVLFRRNEFYAGNMSESEINQLCGQLKTALYHVWFRIHGYKIKGAPKFFHPEALEFLEQHPALKIMLLFLWEENKGSSSTEKLDQYQVKLGVMAATAYLAALRQTDPSKYWAGEVDLTTAHTTLPDWDKAQEFFVKLHGRISGSLNNSEAGKTVVSYLKCLEESKNLTTVLDRDAQLTVTTRAVEAYIDNQEATTNRLRHRLINQDKKDDFVPDFARFGGLDQDREALVKEGWIEDVKIERKLAGGFEPGQKVWDCTPENDPCESEIIRFSEDGGTVYLSTPGYNEGKEYQASIEDIRTDKPEGIGEPVYVNDHNYGIWQGVVTRIESEIEVEYECDAEGKVITVREGDKDVPKVKQEHTVNCTYVKDEQGNVNRCYSEWVTKELPPAGSQEETQTEAEPAVAG